MGAAPTKAIIQQTHPHVKILEIGKQPGQSINKTFSSGSWLEVAGMEA